MNVHQLLNERNIPYERIPHHATYDAQHLADELLLSGKDVAKCVMLRADHGYVYFVAVLPASDRIDFEKVSKLYGGSEIVLATEDEIRRHCPDCEIGVLPPFGSLYGIKTLVDKSLSSNDEIVFEGSTHREALRMKYRDFIQLENPHIAPITADQSSN